jgi:hypothetical protein
VPIPFAGWEAGYAPENAYLLTDPGNYLMHVGFEVDEEVWLTQDDVAKGEDTVVKRAIEWIQNLAYTHDVAVNKTYVKPDIDSVLVTAQVENPNQHDLSVEVMIINLDSTITNYFNMFDDGLHGDGVANNSLWANFYRPTGEQSFKVSVTTNDISAETSRSLPNVTWFTTIGPLNYVRMTPYLLPEITIEPGGINSVKLHLINNGNDTRADNIEARLYSNTPNITIHEHYSRFSNIPAGDTVESAQGYSFQISESIHMDTTIYLMLDISSDGFHFWTDSIELNIVTAINHSPIRIPTTYSLEQNYPNPFNPSTTIDFSLPKPDFVELKVYNILGKEVSTIVSKKLKQGNHTYQFDGKNLASGIYYYQLLAGEYIEVKKMILLK